HARKASGIACQRRQSDLVGIPPCEACERGVGTRGLEEIEECRSADELAIQRSEWSGTVEECQGRGARLRGPRMCSMLHPYRRPGRPRQKDYCRRCPLPEHCEGSAPRVLDLWNQCFAAGSSARREYRNSRC